MIRESRVEGGLVIRTAIGLSAAAVTMTGALVVTWPGGPRSGEPACAAAEAAYAEHDGAWESASARFRSLDRTRPERGAAAREAVDARYRASKAVLRAPTCFDEDLVEGADANVRDHDERYGDPSPS